MTRSWISGTISITLLLLSGYSCKKYLEAPTDKKLVIINSIQDAQSLLDDYSRINYRDVGVGEESADDYFLQHNVWSSLNEFDRARHIWNPEMVIPPYAPNSTGNAWSQTYDIVYVANTVLDYIDKIDIAENPMEWNNLKGQALFLRAKSFLQVAWVWSLAYDSNTAENDLGIPLRLNSDFNTPSVRSNVQQTYDQVIEDLKAAVNLLPISPLHVMRPSKPAAYGYLARTYLSMRKYTEAGAYADSCLALKNDLLDYNDIIPTSPFPTGIGRFNVEVIYESTIPLSNLLFYSRIGQDIYDSYDSLDLRKKIFFRQDPNTSLHIFMGSYEQAFPLFSGIATDEMLITRAECHVRTGTPDKAIDDLNTLLVKRWEAGTFIPLENNDNESTLELILEERRKELIMRGLRWIDIKRLNKEGRNIIPIRTLDQDIHILPSNDLRYAVAIPEDVIALSGITQNPR